MNLYSELKSIWKKLGIRGCVKNYSSAHLWVVETDSSKIPIARILAYYVSGHGWLDFMTTLKMTCYHEIDNARPVFPKKGKPYIRSKRDRFILNNFSNKGKV